MALWDPAQEDQLKKLYAQRQAQTQARQQAADQQQNASKHTSGRGGFLTSLISEGGATGGAAAGAAAGTAVLPGIGTVVGGVLGGLAGGFGGSAVEQKVRDDNVDWGKAATEGAFSAIPGGTGKVVKTLGKKGVERVGKDELAHLFTNEPGKAASFATKTGNDMRANVRGITPKASVQGRSSEKLRPSEADELNAFLSDNGVKGSNTSQLAQMEKIQRDAGDQINNIVAASPKTVSSGDISASEQRIKQSLLGQNGKGVGAFDPANEGHQAIANNYARQQAAITDSTGRLNFKRTLDKDINYSRTSQSPDPVREQIASAFRKEQSDQLNALHPEVKAPNAVYGKAQDAMNVMIRAKDPNGVKLAKGFIDLGGNGVGSDFIQGAKDKIGGVLQKTSGTRPITDQFGRQILASTAQNQLMPSPSTNSDQLPDSVGGLYGDGSGSSDMGDLSSLGGDGMTDVNGGQSTTGLAYSSSDLMTAAQKALATGDTDSYKVYAQAASDAADVEAAQSQASGSNGLNVTKVTAQQYGLAQSGQQALQQLSQMIQSDPSIINKTATPGRTLPVVGGFISNAAGTGQYDAIGYNIADAILRLRTGATANEGEVRNLQAQIMPRAGDSTQTIQTKMQQIANIFQPTLQLAGGQSGGGSNNDDFESQLMAMMNGGQ